MVGVGGAAETVEVVMMDKSYLESLSMYASLAYTEAAGESMKLPVVSTCLQLGAVLKRGFIVRLTGNRDEDVSQVRRVGRLIGIHRRVMTLRQKERFGTVEGCCLYWVENWPFESMTNEEGSWLKFSARGSPLWLTREQATLLVAGKMGEGDRDALDKSSPSQGGFWVVKEGQEYPHS